MSAPDTYRGWPISPPDRFSPWTATGPDFDANYQGEEDGWVGNGYSAWAWTREALIAEIDAWLEDQAA
jgi:hypothetical protein